MSKQLDSTQAWLVFSIDGNYIAIKQSEIVTTLLALDVTGKQNSQIGALSIAYDEKEWPAYNLNNHLIPTANISNKRKFCLVLNHGDKLLGIMCDAIKIIDSDQKLTVFDIPISINKTFSPFKKLTLIDKQIVLIGNTVQLVNYIIKLSEFINKTGANRGRN